MFPIGWEGLLDLIVMSQPVNFALYQNQVEFCILFLSLPLKMLWDSDSFLNQMIQILREIGARPLDLRILGIFITSHKMNWRHTM